MKEGDVVNAPPITWPQCLAYEAGRKNLLDTALTFALGERIFVWRCRRRFTRYLYFWKSMQEDAKKNPVPAA